jgi:hypothetical protein
LDFYGTGIRGQNKLAPDIFPDHNNVAKNTNHPAGFLHKLLIAGSHLQ